MKRIAEIIDKLLAGVLIVLMAAMVVVVTWQVISRFITKNPSSVTEELALFMLIWVGLLGAAYAYRTNMHLGLDLLVNKLQGAGRLSAEIIARVAVAGFAIVVMGVGGWWLVSLNWITNQTTAALQIKMAYINIVLPLSGLLITFYSIVFIVDVITAYRQVQGEK